MDFIVSLDIKAWCYWIFIELHHDKHFYNCIAAIYKEQGDGSGRLAHIFTFPTHHMVPNPGVQGIPHVPLADALRFNQWQPSGA